MLHPALIHRSEAWEDSDPVSLLESADQLSSGDVVFLGLCNEVGVVANGGRPGAADGPRVFRQAFGRMQRPDLGARGIWDAGDVPASVDYAKFIETARKVVADCALAGAIPIVIGGGHDCSFGNYLGLAAATRESKDSRVPSPLHPPAVINIDAHLDVRPEHGPSSGNPFFKMLEHGLPGADLAELGLIRYVNSAAHEAYARNKGVYLHYLEPGLEDQVVTEAKAVLTRFSDRGRQILATVDMDGIGAAWAPGVSATNPWGISADTALQLAHLFGANPSVACFDLMEFAPVHDRDSQTAKLLAFMVVAFLEGVMRRAR